MLVKYSDFLKAFNGLDIAYRGKVVNNQDPLQIGRVQVNIPGLIEGTLGSDGTWNLPWTYQKSPAMLGGNGFSSSFAVPENGSEVFVEFPYGDVYSGFYSYYLQSSATHQGTFNEDYPNSYGFVDSTGNSLKINKAKQFLQFIHSSGAQFGMDLNGVITLQTNNKIVFTSLDQQTQIIFDLLSGAMTLQANETLNTGSQTVNHNASQQNDTIGNHSDTVTGGRNTQIFGGETKAIGGDLGESILGNKAYTVAGSKSCMVALDTDETFGLNKTETVVLGNWKVSVEAGNIVLQTLIGSTEIGNEIGSFTVSTTGEVTAENEIGTISIDPLGNISVENEVASIKVSALGDIKAENEIGSFEIDPTGSITLENETATLSMDPTGDIKLKNEVGGELHINPAGQVALGNEIAELLDLLGQVISSFIENAPDIVLTGVGPGALSPEVIATLTEVQGLLTSITGTL